MGLIGTLLELLRTTVEGTPITDLKVDPGGGTNVTAELYQAAGDDASPLPDDTVAVVEIPGTGRYIAIGFIDPKNEPTAAPGERRLYSRNSDGDIQVTIRLSNDGVVHLAEDEAAALIARADRVESELAAIKQAFASHTHPTNAGTDGTAATVDASTDFGYEPAAVGCDKVKGT